MSSTSEARSVRFAHWWVRRYTSGLHPAHATARRDEIDSDLAEHQCYRQLQGWPRGRVGRERTTRLLRGIAADLGWRRDVLRGTATRNRMLAPVRLITGCASLALVCFHFVFAAFVLGADSMADQPLLGGLANYTDKVDSGLESTIAAVVLGCAGAVLMITAACRPISPLIANVAAITIAGWSVLFFWLGVWPVALIVVIGSAIDLTSRVAGSRLDT